MKYFVKFIFECLIHILGDYGKYPKVPTVTKQTHSWSDRHGMTVLTNRRRARLAAKGITLFKIDNFNLKPLAVTDCTPDWHADKVLEGEWNIELPLYEYDTALWEEVSLSVSHSEWKQLWVQHQARHAMHYMHYMLCTTTSLHTKLHMPCYINKIARRLSITSPKNGTMEAA